MVECALHLLVQAYATLLNNTQLPLTGQTSLLLDSSLCHLPIHQQSAQQPTTNISLVNTHHCKSIIIPISPILKMKQVYSPAYNNLLFKYYHKYTVFLKTGTQTLLLSTNQGHQHPTLYIIMTTSMYTHSPTLTKTWSSGVGYQLRPQ